MKLGGPQGGREFQRRGAAIEKALLTVPMNLTYLIDVTFSKASSADHSVWEG